MTQLFYYENSDPNFSHLKQKYERKNNISQQLKELSYKILK